MGGSAGAGACGADARGGGPPPEADKGAGGNGTPVGNILILLRFL